jgi:hypothetical protein
MYSEYVRRMNYKLLMVKNKFKNKKTLLTIVNSVSNFQAGS